MKIGRVYLTILLLFLFCTTVSAQESPLEYMSTIGKQQENISKKYMAYTSAVAHGKRARKLENLRNKLVNEVEDALSNVRGMSPFNGDKAYRDSAVSFMNLYYNVLNEDYAKIVDMEEISEQSYDDMEAYMMAEEMVDKKMEEGNQRMHDAEEAFAKKNNIRLTNDKDELGEMMDKVHDINVYYHQVYLVFFKPYKQEIYLSEAIGKDNVTGIEQNKNSLLKYANEGLEKLKSMKGFEGDNSLVSNCRTVLQFYLKEVNNLIPAFSDYLLAKQRFETLQKEFEKKSDPSKTEVDNYNKAVKDMNDASKKANSNSKDLNEQREETLKEWDKTVEAYFDEHTPHYK